MTQFIAVWQIDPENSSESGVRLTEMQPASLDEGTRSLPAGGYTTFRTYGRQHVMRLADHFDRLEETARLAGHTSLTINRELVRQALRTAMLAHPAGEMRVRMTLDLTLQPGQIYLLLEPLHMPSGEDYKNGVRVVTRRMQRSNPKAKLTTFIETATAVRQDLPPGINEAVMVGEDGCILEGLSSNFFVLKDGVLWTAEQGVLSGITRSMVLEVIRQEGLTMRLEGFPEADLSQIEEAFITSASRAVLPVTEIDGSPVGNGQSGRITLRLLQGYLHLVAQNLDVV